MAFSVTPATAGIVPVNKASAPSFGVTDPTYDVNKVYSPLKDLLAQQGSQAQARYEVNQANLKNIFGALTGLSQADTVRINDQFTQSIAKQQSDLATRTAEQRAAQAAGAAQATATGAERGSGPALQGSPTATATEQAIGQSNAIQTNWEGLMNAQKNQAVADTQARQAGYGQQQVAAAADLQNKFAETMAGLAQQNAQLDSQIAQADIARQQAIASNNFEAAQQANDLANKLATAKISANARLGAAQIAASARKATAGGSTPKKVTYTKDLTGTLKRVGDTYGTGTAAEFQTQLDNVQANKPTSASDAYNKWIKRFGSRVAQLPQAAQIDIKSSAKDYFNGLTYPKATASVGNWLGIK